MQGLRKRSEERRAVSSSEDGNDSSVEVPACYVDNKSYGIRKNSNTLSRDSEGLHELGLEKGQMSFSHKPVSLDSHNSKEANYKTRESYSSQIEPLPSSYDKTRESYSPPIEPLPSPYLKPPPLEYTSQKLKMSNVPSGPIFESYSSQNGISRNLPANNYSYHIPRAPYQKAIRQSRFLEPSPLADMANSGSHLYMGSSVMVNEDQLMRHRDDLSSIGNESGTARKYIRPAIQRTDQNRVKEQFKLNREPQTDKYLQPETLNIYQPQVLHVPVFRAKKRILIKRQHQGCCGFLNLFGCCNSSTGMCSILNFCGCLDREEISKYYPDGRVKRKVQPPFLPCF